jgi:hypothetical protein
MKSIQAGKQAVRKLFLLMKNHNPTGLGWLVTTAISVDDCGSSLDIRNMRMPE